MSMVAVEQRLARAFVVVGGHYGDVSRYAQKRGVCRQWVDRQAGQVLQHLEATPSELQRLRQEVQDLRQHQAEREQRLARAVVLDKEKQAEFASVGQAQGVSLPVCWSLFDVRIPGQQESGATLGRATHAAGQKAGPLLAVLDEVAQARVRDAAADAIYVTAAVLMVVEQESLCWLTGRLGAEVNGEAWARELRQFPNLAQTARAGGSALAKGVALVNAERPAQGQLPLVDQGDHVHALRGGRVGLRKDEKPARTALATAETAPQALPQCQRQGTSQRLATLHALAAWRKAEQALDTWSERERLWQQTKEALRRFTPDGDLNTRARAEAVLAETLPPLPEAFAQAKRQVQKPEMLNYLDPVHRHLEALPFPEEVTRAAVREEG